MNATAADNPFAPSEFERRKVRRANINIWIMFGFCAVLVVPLVAILVDIFCKAAPVLFANQAPMTEYKSATILIVI